MVRLSLVIGVLLYLVLPVAAEEWVFNPIGYPDVNTIAASVNEDKIFIGIENAGVWKSDDSGISWNGINDILFDDNQVIALSYKLYDEDADTVIARIYHEDCETFYYITYDGGVSWEVLDVSFLPHNHINPNGFDFLIIDDTNFNTWYFANTMYYAKSNDAGQTWQVSIIDSSESIAYGWPKGDMYEDYENNRVYISGYYFNCEGVYHGGVVKSDDNGDTWDNVLPINELFQISEAFVTRIIRLSDGSIIAFIYDSVNERRYIVKSDDNCQSWEEIGDGLPESFYSEHIIEDAGCPGKLFAGSTYRFHGLYCSEDYGESWFRYNEGVFSSAYAIKNIYQNPWTQNIYFAMSGEGVLVTEDNGESFQRLPLPEEVGTSGWRRAPSVSADIISFIDGAERRYLWQVDEETFSCYDTLYSNNDTTYVESNTLWFGDDLQSRLLFKHSIDDFITGACLQVGNVYEQNWDYYNCPVLDRHHYLDNNEGITLFGITQYDSMYYSTDMGRNWQGNRMPVGSYARSIAWCDDTIYIISDLGVVYSTTNFGETWNNEDFPSDQEYPLAIVVVDSLPFVVSETYSWLKLSDFWVSNQGPVYNSERSFITIERSEEIDIVLAYYIFDNLLFSSDDYGATWEEVDYEMPYPSQMRGIQSMVYDKYRDRIWAVTALGLAYCDLDNGVIREPIIFQPATQNLVDVYPNPFNDTSTIKFIMPYSEDIEIKLVDILGRQVRVLTNGYFERGEHRITLETDGLASGTYFIRCTIAQQQIVKKIMLVR